MTICDFIFMKTLRYSLLSIVSVFITLLFLTNCGNPNKKAVKVFKNIEYGRYKLEGGEGKLLLDLYLPAEKTTQPLPVLIYLHGGGWMGGTKDGCPGEIFVEQGYVLACVSYRFSNQALFPAQIHDVKRAIRWLRKNADNYNLDPNKFGAWGWSAGGHLSALLGTSAGVPSLEGEEEEKENLRISSAIQAACSWYGPTDFTQVQPAFENITSSTEIEQYQDHPSFAYTIATTNLLGGSVSAKSELATLANPITHIDPRDPPFLIIHGEKDNVVPIHQSNLLANALAQNGVEVTFIRDPNLGHSYTGSKGEAFNRTLIKATVDFFDTHLKSN